MVWCKTNKPEERDGAPVPPSDVRAATRFELKTYRLMVKFHYSRGFMVKFIGIHVIFFNTGFTTEAGIS